VRLILSFILIIAMLLSYSESRAAMYSFVDEYGGLHFTNVPADPRYREVPGYEKIRELAGQVRFSSFINSAARHYNLAPELIQAIIKVESSFNPFAISEKGAMGLMQLMPETAKEMNVGAPFEPEENIMGGSRYLRKLHDLFDGDLRLVLAAYNAGPNRILENGRRIPKIPETEDYVEKVLREYGRIRESALASQ
jgi:soluble lytic murein transglycosylase-like protein